MTPRPALFVNPLSGGGRADHADVAGEARRRGVDVTVLRPGDDLAALARQAAEDGAETLGAAGGDGSLALVATAAVAHGLPFVVVPAGTRNHFALDLGLDPQDLIGSLDAFGGGTERRVDVGDLNGRLFLNNVSLGVYGDAVWQPAYRGAKARTLLQTAAAVLGPGAAATGVELADDRRRIHRDPAVVLVSNNPYSLEPPRRPGTRAALDGGTLGVIVLDQPRAGRTPARAWTDTRLEVHAESPMRAGIDGEAVELLPPLRFAIRPGALRIRTAGP